MKRAALELGDQAVASRVAGRSQAGPVAPAAALGSNETALPDGSTADWPAGAGRHPEKHGALDDLTVS